MSAKIIGVTVGTNLNTARIIEKIKSDDTIINFASDEEVETLLTEIYGNEEDEDIIVDDDFASDEEVTDMLDKVFGA